MTNETMSDATGERAADADRDIHDERILVLDFGGQTTQLIARRVREAGVYCEIRPWSVSDDEAMAFGARGVILSGGPESVVDEGAPRIPQVLLDSDVPMLGICYGMQAMVAQLGGSVVRASDFGEFGYASMRVTGAATLLDDLQDRLVDARELDVWMSHGDRVEALPDGYRAVGTSENAPFAAMADDTGRRFGIQFHPEVTHTRQGATMLTRFVRDTCGCAGLWTAGNIVDDAVARVRAQVGDDRVLLALSGGVDSSVVAAMLHRAIGDRLTCVFVDNGLLRLGEGDQVMATFAESLGVRVIRVDAEARFLDALAGVTDPEAKRKVIGGLFVDVFDEEAGKLDGIRWLAQGTIYPDVIESAGSGTGGGAHLIKSHHNVGGLPETMRMELVEPLRELFKDEVRRVGVELGLPPEMVMRHPFPGPGLGVRILGEVSKDFADTLRAADAIYIDALRAHGLYDAVSQAFAVFLPVKSVGVTGDGRRYAHVVSLRAVETIDFMTARAAHLPYEFLDEVSRRICNSIPGVSRVVYDVSSKPPGTIEWE